MLDFSATQAAFTGFRFVRRHPLAALIWAGLHFLVGALMGVVVMGRMGPLLAQMMAANRSHDTTAALALYGQLAPFYGLLLLFSLAFYPVVLAAVNRAVLEPEHGRFAYLRLGMDEVRQLLLILLIMVVFIAAEIVAGLLLVILILALRTAGPAPAAIGGVILGLAILGGAVFVWVRLSLAMPMTFASRKVSLFRTWSLTRGRFWKIFGAYVLAWALALVVYVLVALIIGAISAATGVGGAGLLAMFPSSAAAAGQLALSPISVILMGVSAAANALLLPVLLMPAADIYRQIRPEALEAQLDVF